MLLHRTVQQLLKSPKFLGRDYLIEKLPKWFLKPAEGEVIVKTRFGFSIHLDPSFDKNIENVIYERGVYEQGTTEYIRQTLKAGDCFVDVGANIGYLSLVAAAAVQSNGRVYAFEPVHSTFEILEKNKELNGFKHIQTHQFALGNTTESLTIYPEKENRGGASITNKRSDKGEEIQVKRLDDLHIGQKVNLLKVDVEGFEWEVLKGAAKTIQKDKPIIIVEYSRERNNEGNSSDMLSWLQSEFNYKAYRFIKGKERKSKLAPCISKTVGLPEHDNIVCLP